MKTGDPDPVTSRRNYTLWMHLWEQRPMFVLGTSLCTFAAEQEIRITKKQKQKQNTTLCSALTDSSRIHSRLNLIYIFSCSAVWDLPLTLWCCCSNILWPLQNNNPSQLFFLRKVFELFSFPDSPWCVLRFRTLEYMVEIPGSPGSDGLGTVVQEDDEMGHECSFVFGSQSWQ